jgi:peptidoglycan/LPS O-acetylase OafA/YrhL
MHIKTPNSLAAPSGSRLEMLDLLRGIAALAVLVYHSEHFLGAQLMASAYLAVDLFFFSAAS